MDDQAPEPVENAQMIPGERIDIRQVPKALDYFELLEARPLKAGTLVEAKVAALGEPDVTVEVDEAKGLVAAAELGAVAVGDTVRLYVETAEDEIRLSRAKAIRLDLWARLSDARSSGELVDGEIIAESRGGLSVDIGVKAHMPAREAGTGTIDDLRSLIGVRDKFRVIRFNARKGTITVSRRAAHVPVIESRKEDLIEELEVGQVYNGVVRRLTKFGAFVDIGGIDGLVHVTDMSFGRVGHPREVLDVDDQVTVKVLEWDLEKEKLGLGIKQLLPNPWESASERYAPDQVVTGTVVGFTAFGAFVEVEPGIEGMVHVSELSWGAQIKHPKDAVRKGERVEARILNISPPNQRMRLSIKRAANDPWADFADRYPLGTIIKGPVSSVTDFGVFVTIEPGVDGLVHQTDIAWAQAVVPKRRYKVGQEVDAMVLEVDRERERVGLGIKQLTPDNTAEVFGQFSEGDVVEGKVTRIKSFGAFFELPNGVEGLIHISELSDDKVEKPEDVVKAGKRYRAVIIGIEPAAGRIRFSLRNVPEPEETEPEEAPVEEAPAEEAPVEEADTKPYPAAVASAAADYGLPAPPLAKASPLTKAAEYLAKGDESAAEASEETDEEGPTAEYAALPPEGLGESADIGVVADTRPYEAVSEDAPTKQFPVITDKPAPGDAEDTVPADGLPAPTDGVWPAEPEPEDEKE